MVLWADHLKQSLPGSSSIPTFRSDLINKAGKRHDSWDH